MAVDERHPDYLKNESKWHKCRVCVEGEEAVKEAGEAFLPRLGGQDEEEYSGYTMRASFFAGTARAVNALVSMLFKKPARVEGATDELETICPLSLRTRPTCPRYKVRY